MNIMPSALKRENIIPIDISTPDYGEKMIIQHLNTPTSHFYHPFITFEETG